ncbi:hypothetical protein CLM62_30620 [Streptomyces sp. SA15]|nr:hypothetical protein CLM62_30620 [Streptomyces sp. SA15]
MAKTCTTKPGTLAANGTHHWAHGSHSAPNQSALAATLRRRPPASSAEASACVVGVLAYFEAERGPRRRRPAKLHADNERKSDHFLAFTSIACTLICYRRLAK